jgi:hypothetical protein
LNKFKELSWIKPNLRNVDFNRLMEPRAINGIIQV